MCATAKKRTNQDTRIFIVTLSPGDSVWSSFGHTLLWVSDGKKEIDTTYNFGTFDSSQDQLLFRYLNGELVYSVRMQSYQKDLERYNGLEKRWFIAQRLLLPPQNQQKLLALLEKYQDPSNLDFVYHWEKANCATKVRDLIDQSLEGQFYTQNQEETALSYRHEALRHLWNNPWVWFGWNYMPDQGLVIIR